MSHHIIHTDGRGEPRDLWRQKDVGTVEGEFTTKVPRHGAVLLKILPTNERVAH